jgi:hypothetical protein
MHRAGLMVVFAAASILVCAGLAWSMSTLAEQPLSMASRFVVVGLAGVAFLTWALSHRRVMFPADSLLRFAVLLMPLIKGLTLHIGAQWEPYLFPTYLLGIWLFFSGQVPRRTELGLLLVLLLNSAAATTIHLTVADLPKMDPVLVAQLVSRPVLAAVEHTRLIGCCLMFLIVQRFVQTREDVVQLLSWFTQSAILAALLVVYEVFVRVTGAPLPLLNPKVTFLSSSGRAFGTFYEPSTAGDFFLCGILALFAVYAAKPIRLRYFVPQVGVLVFALLSCSSLTGLLAGAAALVTIFLGSPVSQRVMRRVLVYTTFIAAGAVAVFYVFPTIRYHVEDRVSRLTKAPSVDEAGFNLTQRIDLLFNPDYATIPLYNPINGIGAGMCSAEFGSYPMFFRIPTEFGLIGCGVLALLYLQAVIGAARCYASSFAPIAPFLSGMIVAMTVFFFNYNTTNDGWIWFLASVLISTKYVAGSEPVARAGIKSIAPARAPA